MNPLQEYLHENVDVVGFYRAELDDFEPGHNVLCPFHKDTSASLSINTESLGEYYCHSAKCSAKGTSFVGFYCQRHGVPYERALQEIYYKYVRPVIPPDVVDAHHTKMLETPSLHEWMIRERGITLDTMRYYRLGFDGSRLTIPIENQFGMYINIRRYDVTRKSDAKMVSYDKGYGRGALYPIHATQEDKIILVEGELDCLLGRQYGLNCICSTSGAGYWRPEFTRMFRDKDVIILFDNDEAGNAGAEKIIAELTDTARTVMQARYPFEGADLTDCIVQHRMDGDGLRAIIGAAEVVAQAAYGHVRPKTYQRVPLSEAANPHYRGKPIEFRAHVAGKDTQPYFVPRRVRVTCKTRPERKCGSCASSSDPYMFTKTLDLTEEAILGLINSTDTQLHKNLKNICRCKRSCDVDIEVLETVCFEEVKLSAPIDEVGAEEEFKYVMRIAYVMDYNISANATYNFRGFAYPDPATQHVVFLIVDTEPSADQLDHYMISQERAKELQQYFPGGRDAEKIHDFLSDLYDYLALKITKIYERRALHQAADLVFHSAIGFNFNGEPVKRGWLDVLIMGDTRTGKGYVTDRLCRYYRVGEIASGENCTFSGLVGGLQQLGARKSWVVTWGILPRNDRRLTCIDEASAITSDSLSRMSRVRSEGVAEVFKIVTERTLARTRLIWNANPSDGRSVREFDHGVEAIATVTDKKEDIARFDYAIVVASDEVNPDIINARHTTQLSDRNGLRDACHDLILWIWSRRPDDVQFEDGAVDIILRESIRLGRKYHVSIPLIQIENVREKVAKVAVAIAGRVFSTNDSADKIIVTPACARYAVGFFEYIYDRESMAYDIYSTLKTEQNTLRSEDELLQLFAAHKKRARSWVNDLLDTPKITIKSLESSLGLESLLAKEVRNKLVELRAIRQEHSYWVKREPFIAWLRKLRVRIIKNPDSWWERREK